MANIYLPDETKKLVLKVAKLDHRKYSDEIHFLFEKRLNFLKPPQENKDEKEQ